MKTADFIHTLKDIPDAKDVVSKVDIDDKYGIARIHFKSGKSITIVYKSKKGSSINPLKIAYKFLINNR